LVLLTLILFHFVYLLYVEQYYYKRLY